jgi:hypothetical protein
MSAQHTPGPWFAVGYQVEIERENVADICTTNAHLFGQPSLHKVATAMANARLIAAAPDMLAMLQEVADYLDRYADVIDGDDGQPEANEALRLLTAVTDVIAAAK